MPDHQADQQIAIAKAAALVAARAAMAARVRYPDHDEQSAGRVPVSVEHEGQSLTIEVPFAISEEHCAVLEAESRAWEAMVYAAAGLDEEALTSAAAVYTVMERLPDAHLMRDQLESDLPEAIREALAPYFLAGMADESAHAQHVHEILEQARLGQKRARLHARYADALVRMKTAVELQQVLLTRAAEHEVDHAFLARCGELFAA